jgi:hypothetical protein
VTGQLNDVFRHLINQRLTLNVSLKTEEGIVNARVEELGERLLLGKRESDFSTEQYFLIGRDPSWYGLVNSTQQWKGWCFPFSLPRGFKQKVIRAPFKCLDCCCSISYRCCMICCTEPVLTRGLVYIAYT